MNDPVSGGLFIPAEKLGRLKLDKVNCLRITHLGDDLIITPNALPGGRARPLLYGDLRLFHVAELLALVSSMEKDGSLSILVPHARKTIFFEEGEIIFASSTVEDDRLSELLWRRGVINLEQLSDIYGLITPQKKSGAVLLEKGLITPRQLHYGLREQVLEIVFSTFAFERGEFVFMEGKTRPKGRVKLDQSTKEIIFEGVQRMAESSRCREELGSRSRSRIGRISDPLPPQSRGVVDLTGA